MMNLKLHVTKSSEVETIYINRNLCSGHGHCMLKKLNLIPLAAANKENLVVINPFLKDHYGPCIPLKRGKRRKIIQSLKLGYAKDK